MRQVWRLLLYLIEILHQTTTGCGCEVLTHRLYLIEILHQTTTTGDSPLFCYTLYLIEILHQTTTRSGVFSHMLGLYLIEILHQTTTLVLVLMLLCRCILSKFYIKPQLGCDHANNRGVVSYRNSTSNHNVWLAKATHKRLYLIEILHQTTTVFSLFLMVLALYLIEILHQTTTRFFIVCLHRSCILSKFYIKPQLTYDEGISWKVVSYRNSTSNHNSATRCVATDGVVSYRNSTSNHNSASSASLRVVVVSYRNSTSNHNGGSRYSDWLELYLIEILHQTTTAPSTSFLVVQLYLIEILHQTTTGLTPILFLPSCILSKFYIKPQPTPEILRV